MTVPSSECHHPVSVYRCRWVQMIPMLATTEWYSSPSIPNDHENHHPMPFITQCHMDTMWESMFLAAPLWESVSDCGSRCSSVWHYDTLWFSVISSDPLWSCVYQRWVPKSVFLWQDTIHHDSHLLASDVLWWIASGCIVECDMMWLCLCLFLFLFRWEWEWEESQWISGESPIGSEWSLMMIIASHGVTGWLTDWVVMSGWVSECLLTLHIWILIKTLYIWILIKTLHIWILVKTLYIWILVWLFIFGFRV